MASFPEILTYLRKSKGLTQKELSLILGLRPSTVSMYENGKREPSFEILEAIADFFNVDMNYLMSGSATPNELVNGDPELTAYLEVLRTRPEMRMLFSVAKGATKEDVEKAVAIIEALRKTEGK